MYVAFHAILKTGFFTKLWPLNSISAPVPHFEGIGVRLIGLVSEDVTCFKSIKAKLVYIETNFGTEHRDSWSSFTNILLDDLVQQHWILQTGGFCSQVVFIVHV